MKHGDTKAHFNILNTELNGALEAFTAELRAQGVWDDVTIVAVSEFGRTLTMNSGMWAYKLTCSHNSIHLCEYNLNVFIDNITASGSDHAWGGNYFMMGGEVAGKRILGKYPEILSDDGPQIIPPGVVIPTLSWDSIWNGIAQWFGITDSIVSDVDIIFFRPT